MDDNTIASEDSQFKEYSELVPNPTSIRERIDNALSSLNNLNQVVLSRSDILSQLSR